MPVLRPTKKQLARHIRGLDLLKVPMSELAGWCQFFGKTGRGTREELVERVHHEIWRKEYDELGEYT